MVSNSGRRVEGNTFARITKLGMRRVVNMIKAMTLVVHPKPIRGWSSWKTIGYMTPPAHKISETRNGRKGGFPYQQNSLPQQYQWQKPF